MKHSRFRNGEMGVAVLCLVLLYSASLLAGVMDDPALTNEIRTVSMRLRGQQSNLSEAELEKLADTLGRSNYLVRTIPTQIWRNDFTNAALLNQFPGKLVAKPNSAIRRGPIIPFLSTVLLCRNESSRMKWGKPKHYEAGHTENIPGCC